MRAKRTDSNHAKLVRELRTAGFTVADTSGMGSGFPDLVISRQRVTKLVEVKSPKGKLRLSQAEFISRWQDEVIVAKDVLDVINYFQQLVRIV